MHITDITPTKRGRYSVFVDGDFYGVLHATIYVKAKISPGCEIPQVDLDDLIRESGMVIAREKALSLLSGRAYTESGLYVKLIAFTDEQSAADAVSRMKELGLVDDLDYARRYAADCINLKGYSATRTRLALRQKGIFPEDIDEAMIEYDEQDAEMQIARLITRKYLSRLQTEDGRRKAAAALQRKGFRWFDIQAVINNLLDDDKYYDEV